jgi:DNA-directed RNA polymerase III subunit RPC7
MRDPTVSFHEQSPDNREPKNSPNTTVVDLFPAELRPTLSGTRADGQPTKKRRTLGVTKVTGLSQIERLIQSEQERTNEAEARAEEEADEEAEDEDEDLDDDKPDAVDEEDNWSAASTDSEESDDDYNAEQYFDNGEDEDIDDADPYENTYE